MTMSVRWWQFLDVLKASENVVAFVYRAEIDTSRILYHIVIQNPRIHVAPIRVMIKGQ